MPELTHVTGIKILDHVIYNNAHGPPIGGYNLWICEINNKVITSGDHPNGVREHVPLFSFGACSENPERLQCPHTLNQARMLQFLDRTQVKKKKEVQKEVSQKEEKSKSREKKQGRTDCSNIEKQFRKKICKEIA